MWRIHVGLLDNQFIPISPFTKLRSIPTRLRHITPPLIQDRPLPSRHPDSLSIIARHRLPRYSPLLPIHTLSLQLPIRPTLFSHIWTIQSSLGHQPPSLRPPRLWHRPNRLLRPLLSPGCSQYCRGRWNSQKRHQRTGTLEIRCSRSLLFHINDTVQSPPLTPTTLTS